MSTDKIIGIDLGSYYSAVSVYEGNEIKIIPNSEGELTTSSCVAFLKEGGIKVGSSAKRQTAINPSGTLFNIKRLMGKSYDQVKDLKRPYKIVNNSGKAAISVYDKIYTPEEISAMILQKMKKTAEDFLGYEVKRAVITVPAFYNSDERASVMAAAEIAGLKCERVIAEPTAAILNIDSKSEKKYMVVDTGGCTTDISVIDVADGVFEIVSTNGDLDLGGSLMDAKIVEWLVEEFKKEEGLDLSKDPMAYSRLYEAAEKAKIELSSSAIVDINLPYITAIDNVPKHLVKQLSVSKFNQMIEPIVDKIISISKESLKLSKLNISDIDEILLVGGTTRVPLVQEKLESTFGKKPSKALNPDTCVSTGASVQSSILAGNTNDILLLDVIPLSIGIETMGGVFTKLIEANTTIPTRKSETFSTASDSQTSVDIHILQGERAMSKDNKSLGRFVMEGVELAPRGVPKINVEINVDANGIISVNAKDEKTGKQNSIRIEGGGSLSKEDIERMKQEAADNAEKDKKELENISKLNSADSLIFQTEKFIKESADKLSEEDKKELEDKITELKTLHKEKNVDDLDKATESLNETWTKISTKIYNQINENDSSTKNHKDDTSNTTEDVPFEEIK
jgi:molecular chaperone DnaK